MKGDFFSLLEEMLLIKLQIIARNALVNHGDEKDENTVVFHDGWYAGESKSECYQRNKGVTKCDTLCGEQKPYTRSYL